MRTRIAITSWETFLDIQEKLPKRRAQVLEAFIRGERLTAYEVAERCSLPLHTVTGRINELRYDYWYIIKDGTKDGRSLYRLRREGENPDKQFEILEDDAKKLYFKYKNSGSPIIWELENILRKHKKL